jgi:hypothetical protein
MMETEQIIEELETLATYFGNGFDGKETKEHAILTAAANRLTEYEEMMAKGQSVLNKVEPVLRWIDLNTRCMCVQTLDGASATCKRCEAYNDLYTEGIAFQRQIDTAVKEQK